MEKKINPEELKKKGGKTLQEFKDFIEEMKTNEPEVIVNSAYQIAIKEELVGIFYPQEDKYDIEEIKALNKLPEPLEDSVFSLFTLSSFFSDSSLF